MNTLCVRHQFLTAAPTALILPPLATRLKALLPRFWLLLISPTLSSHPPSVAL